MESLLEESYDQCRRLNASHGKTYYFATLFLPKAKRKYVHALYGFARYADEIVDDLASTLTEDEKADALRTWGSQILADVKSGTSKDPVGRALVDTAKKFNIPIRYFEDFLRSMEMDLTITEYRTYEDLLTYIHGSAAVIGLQMAPILGYSDERALAAAEKLGRAFQLANFIRDVAEDLDRGRVYLPLEDLARFGVTRADLEKRVLTPNIISALKYQIERVRTLQREADEGIKYLDPTSRPCIQAASELYCGIVDEVEKISFDIFNKRAHTSTLRKLKVAAKTFPRALLARIR